ncbi:hypothetical protein HKI87_10g63700 [Chloropicon roscoffensis]|uniref:Uncharacterized protein n=3 Tax=Chloropicon roscoffensis TaxID=1461544 RepID=A0AAX4PFV3_9CHLO
MADAERGQDHRCLRDLLEQWGVQETLTEGMSRRWRARVVPLARTEDEVLDHVLNGVPVLLGDPRHASKPFEAIGRGSDKGCALEYFCGGEMDALSRPKIAFLGGWGAPGSDFSSEEYLSLVANFSDVVDPKNENPKNLQMFHRPSEDEGGEDGAQAREVPVLPRELDWPLRDLLGSSGEVAGGPTDAGVVVDNATRVSQRGAVTWWHLDDGGEFVLQVGLPLSKSRQRDPRFWGESGRPIVKIFIFAEKRHYKLIAQDLVTNKTSRAACLDLFNTPSEYLPEGDDDDVLPVFWVAPLLAGGYPLLSPPNAPHMVVTAQDCVMIEQRRISKLFLDEVEYFLRRAKIWNTTPIFYDFIETELRDPNLVLSNVVEPLVALGTKALKSLQEAGGEAEAKLWRRVLARIDSSLKTLLLEELFAAALEATRVRIREFQRELQARGIQAEALDSREAERAALISDMAEEDEKVYRHGGKAFYALVHERGSPRWGVPRQTREEAVKDRKKLKRAAMERKLHTTLMQMKAEA